MTRKTKYLVFGVGVFTACVSSFMFSRPVQAADESLTLETYYPAPYGIYSELTTTGQTLLATEGGNVGIGMVNPQAKLEVGGGIKVGFDSDVCDVNKEGTMRWNNTIYTMQYCNGTSWGSLGDPPFWLGNAGVYLRDGANSSASCELPCGSTCVLPRLTVNAWARVNAGVVQTKVTGSFVGITGSDSCNSGWVSADTVSCSVGPINTYTGSVTAEAKASGVLALVSRSGGGSCFSLGYWN